MSVELEQRRRTGRRRRIAPQSAFGPAGWKLTGAYAALWFERVWPTLLTALAPPFLIAVIGLFGAFDQMPAMAHVAALALAAAASLAALWTGRRDMRTPRRTEALARLEEDGGLAHAPLRALEDRPFASDPRSPLWLAHLAEARAAAHAARLRPPRPTGNRRDPYSLRFGAVGLTVVALVAAGPEAGRRLSRAFDPGAAFGSATAFADVWIEPPAYAKRAPIYLLRHGEPVGGLRAQIDAPQGSLVVAQAGAQRRMDMRFSSASDELRAEPSAAASGRLELKLAASGLLTLRLGGAEGRWPIGILRDAPPEVDFIDPPGTTDDARLSLALSVRDDYGIEKARLDMRLDPDQELPLDAPPLDPLALRQTRSLVIEGVAGKPGERRFDLDLQADPWAGLVVFIKVAVIDGAGQESATSEAQTRLPERPFFNPLAKAVIEQRRTLAVSAENWPRVGRSLDALTLAPDRFYERPSDYLLMRAAFWRVMQRGDSGFEDAVGAFWPLALQLEDEALELARQRLEAAQERLKAALEAGASEAEIARLVEELREAMRQYLAALERSGGELAEDGGADSETLEAGDLERMLDAIRDLSQSGARGAARQALSDLEALLRNLRLSAGRSGSGQSGAGASGPGGLPGEAGDLIGRQRDLANRSFERGQSGERGGDLAGEQSGLAADVERLIGKLGSGGAADPEGAAAGALKGALDEMRAAERALSADNFDAAGTAMERAIGALREGARALADAQQGGEGGGQSAGARGGAGLDPLGRPLGEAYGRGVDVPEGSDLQRAREVLEELRRRLSDGRRSDEEIKYLERLLERF